MPMNPQVVVVAVGPTSAGRGDDRRGSRARALDHLPALAIAHVRVRPALHGGSYSVRRASSRTRPWVTGRTPHLGTSVRISSDSAPAAVPRRRAWADRSRTASREPARRYATVVMRKHLLASVLADKAMINRAIEPGGDPFPPDRQRFRMPMRSFTRGETFCPSRSSDWDADVSPVRGQGRRDHESNRDSHGVAATSGTSSASAALERS